MVTDLVHLKWKSLILSSISWKARIWKKWMFLLRGLPGAAKNYPMGQKLVKWCQNTHQMRVYFSAKFYPIFIQLEIQAKWSFAKLSPTSSSTWGWVSLIFIWSSTPPPPTPPTRESLFGSLYEPNCNQASELGSLGTLGYARTGVSLSHVILNELWLGYCKFLLYCNSWRLEVLMQEDILS